MNARAYTEAELLRIADDTRRMAQLEASLADAAAQHMHIERARELAANIATAYAEWITLSQWERFGVLVGAIKRRVEHFDLRIMSGCSVEFVAAEMLRAEVVS